MYVGKKGVVNYDYFGRKFGSLEDVRSIKSAAKP